MALAAAIQQHQLLQQGMNKQTDVMMTIDDETAKNTKLILMERERDIELIPHWTIERLLGDSDSTSTLYAIQSKLKRKSHWIEQKTSDSDSWIDRKNHFFFQYKT